MWSSVATPSPILLRARSTFAFRHEVRDTPWTPVTSSFSFFTIQGLCVNTCVESEDFQVVLQSKHADWSPVHSICPLSRTRKASNWLKVTHMHIHPLVFLSAESYNHLSCYKKYHLSSALHKVPTDNSSPITWKDSTWLRKQLVFVVEHWSFRMSGRSFLMASSQQDTKLPSRHQENPSLHCF